MKKLLIITLALVTLNGFAQQKDHKRMNKQNHSELRKEMSPNDIAGLKTKQLTLKLDLTEAQQKEVHQVILEQSQTNEKLRSQRQLKSKDQKEKPSKEEMLKMKNDRLDQQIKMKRDMKAILSAEQYAKYESMNSKNKGKRGTRSKKDK